MGNWDKDIERLVLFADFMGFKERVMRTTHKKLEAELDALLSKIHQQLKPLKLGKDEYADLMFVEYTKFIKRISQSCTLEIEMKQ